MHILTKAERFALNQWLSDFPDDLSYRKIMAILMAAENTWSHNDIAVWAVVEDCTLEQVAGFIDNTRLSFEAVTA